MAKFFNTEGRKNTKEKLNEKPERNYETNKNGNQKRVYLNLVESDKKSKCSVSSVRTNTIDNTVYNRTYDQHISFSSNAPIQHQTSDINLSLNYLNEAQNLLRQSWERKYSFDQQVSKQALNHFQLYKTALHQRSLNSESMKEFTGQDSDWSNLMLTHI